MFQNPRTTIIGYLALAGAILSYVAEAFANHGPGTVTPYQLIGIVIGILGIVSRDGSQ